MVRGEENLHWFQSSKKARRTHCGQCGSTMFWHSQGDENYDIAAGTLDLPTGLKTKAHIFVDDASDFTSFDDNVPRYRQRALAEGE